MCLKFPSCFTLLALSYGTCFQPEKKSSTEMKLYVPVTYDMIDKGVKAKTKCLQLFAYRCWQTKTGIRVYEDE